MTTETKPAKHSALWIGYNVTLPLLRGKALLALGKHEAAITVLNEVKAKKVPSRGLDLMRAKCRFKQKRMSEAYEMTKEELRMFPDNKEAAKFLASLDYQHGSDDTFDDPEFKALLKIIRPYTMLSVERLWSLYNNAKRICEEDLPGNFAECGVAGGGSSAFLAGVIKKHTKRPRKLYSFDTFDGMPAPTEHDVHQGMTAQASGWGEGTCAAPIDSLKKVVAEVGVSDIVVPVKGYFCDTLPVTKSEIGEIALLHLDGDWYSSTRDILVNLYDQVAIGGFMQIDDYGFWEGCRTAIHEYEKQNGLNFKLTQIDYCGYSMIKQEKPAVAS